MVKRKISFAIGLFAIGFSCLFIFVLKMMKRIERFEKKKFNLERVNKNLIRWLRNSIDGKKVADYFLSMGAKRIAIYGMSEIGKTLYEELKKSEDIVVEYGIDSYYDSIFSELSIIGPDDEWPNIDIIVVTSIGSYPVIEQIIHKKSSYPCISIEEVLFQL